MKLNKKILSALLVSACFLSQQSAHAAPVNAYVGASMGFQRGWGSLNGGTFTDGSRGGGGRLTIPYSGRIAQSDPVGDLFFEVDTKVSHCFSIGLRPYYHLNSFETVATGNADVSTAFGAAAGDFLESVEFTVRRRHAYGLLFVPKMSFKEMTLYGLLGGEFSRFKTRINRNLIEPAADTVSFSFSKAVSSSAAVVGLGVSRELGNWSLFAEGQCKFYQTKKFEADLNSQGLIPLSQFLKFSPKFASVMVGVKFKLV